LLALIKFENENEPSALSMKSLVFFEGSISKMTNLTKTIMNDCKTDTFEKFQKGISENEEKHNRSRNNGPNFDQEGSQQQCTQS
jgi:hypothetical protein